MEFGWRFARMIQVLACLPGQGARRPAQQEGWAAQSGFCELHEERREAPDQEREQRRRIRSVHSFPTAVSAKSGLSCSPDGSPTSPWESFRRLNPLAKCIALAVVVSAVIAWLIFSGA